MDEDDIQNQQDPPLVLSLKDLVKAESYDDLKSKLCDENNVEALETELWDVIGELCSHLTEENELYKEKLVDACETGLLHISKTCSAKESLLYLLEQLDCFKDDLKFKLVLTPIQNVLLRLPAKRQHSLEFTLTTVYAHVEELPALEDYQLENEETKLLSANENVTRYEDLVKVILDFLQPFVSEVSKVTVDEKEIVDKILHQRETLAKFLLKLLEKPLVCLDLSTYENDSCSGSRLLAQRIIDQMSEMFGDFHKMTQNLQAKSVKLNESDEKVSKLGLSCFCYLVLCEHIQIDHYPSVYNQLYTLEYALQFIICLSNQKHSLATRKGISMATTLVGNIPCHSLQHYFLESDDFMEFLEAMAMVMIQSPMKELRQDTVKCLPVLLSKFNSHGRNMLIYHILNKCTHSGLLGYIIQLFKDEIDHSLTRGDDSDLWFLGKHVSSHFDIIFRLPDSALTDLLDKSDHIMAALNLLRYLVIRDPPHVNATGIWQRVEHLQQSFLEQIRKAIDMSRAHYRMKLEKVSQKGKKKNEAETEFNVSVGGAVMPNIPKDQQKHIMQVALDNFDMIESVAVRVQELIEHNKKPVLKV